MIFDQEVFKKTKKDCVKAFSTTTVHHKIRGEESMAQNYTRAKEPSPDESGVQFEDATDQNCLKSNESKIRSCFVDILAAFHFNFASSLYLSFCLQPVDTVRQIFPFFN